MASSRAVTAHGAHRSASRHVWYCWHLLSLHISNLMAVIHVQFAALETCSFAPVLGFIAHLFHAAAHGGQSFALHPLHAPARAENQPGEVEGVVEALGTSATVLHLQRKVAGCSS